MKPFIRQIFVASSQLLAAVSVGAVIAYPNVVLEQLRSEASMILDMDLRTWIGSTHGLVGIPCILMPTFMQWRGRKLSFILTCLLIIIGWAWTAAASNATHIIIGECFHGLGAHSLVIVSNCVISETFPPNIRTVTMAAYIVSQSFGMSMVSIIGRFVYWKTVGWIMSVPILVALLISCMSPETPCWLAWKGYDDKCAKALKWLRGTGDDVERELNALLCAQKENKAFTKSIRKRNNFKDLLSQISRRDFYVPALHTFVYFWTFYWSGTMVVIIYAMEIIRKSTSNETAAFYCMIFVDIVLFIGCLSGTFLLNSFKNKSILLTSQISSATILLISAATTYLQTKEVISKDSIFLVYLIVAFVLSYNFGMSTLTFSMPIELMPLKHRGIGGALYVIFIGTLHSASLKISPYMFQYIDLWGTFLIYAINAMFGAYYVHTYVPETKGRSLHEIERYYNSGRFITYEKDNENCEDISL
ncbi:facilitated trehalose transporter Tret1 isoform X1 [Bombyx mori]|uniref:Major facilitator superfamily (MFS) profile domain-containing protein n=2 Tax=Bombyx mori TaxID=7091 RepID=A0A8R2C522_BOMMO|nr:facilitated trehalose transporter Tret1 isoform X1 [Bombyx mori]